MFKWSNSIDLGVGGIDGDEDGVETSANWSATNFLYASRICSGVARLASSSVIPNLKYLARRPLSLSS